jgi:hypothetical protein
MKPTPTSNFSIWAYPAGLDEEGAPPALFEGAYGVRLNNTITVTFVPEYPRTADGWPAIDVPGGYPGPTAVFEARAWVAFGARYVIAPGDSAPPSSRLVDDTDQSQFLVTPADYGRFAGELEWIADTVPRIGRRLTDLPDLRVARLLVDEIIPSDAFAARDRYWLSDPQ